jgi:hypothetical protein
MLAHNAMVVGLEQGVVALLSSKSTQALLRFVPAAELALSCASLVAVLQSVPRQAVVAGRVSRLVSRVLATIALNTVLQSVARAPDAGIAAVNLLSVFFLSGVLDPDGAMATTAQFLLVSTLSDALQASDALSGAWALAFLPGLPEDVAVLAQLVSVETFSTWLRGWMPPSLLLPSAALLLYLCAPFTAEFPTLGRLYRFAVFAFSEDAHFSALPAWLIAAGLWALYRMEPDSVSRRLASAAGVNVAVLAVLDATRFALDNDPAPTLLGLLVAIRILEEGFEKSSGPITGAGPPSRQAQAACSHPPGTPRMR